MHWFAEIHAKIGTHPEQLDMQSVTYRCNNSVSHMPVTL